MNIIDDTTKYFLSPRLDFTSVKDNALKFYNLKNYCFNGFNFIICPGYKLNVNSNGYIIGTNGIVSNYKIIRATFYQIKKDRKKYITESYIGAYALCKLLKTNCDIKIYYPFNADKVKAVNFIVNEDIYFHDEIDILKTEKIFVSRSNANSKIINLKASS